MELQQRIADWTPQASLKMFKHASQQRQVLLSSVEESRLVQLQTKLPQLHSFKERFG